MTNTTPKTGTTTNTKDYGRIFIDSLEYKGKYYKIKEVNPETLVLDTDKLFGKYGDEFPLRLIAA